jgi:hypothetical protein
MARHDGQKRIILTYPADRLARLGIDPNDLNGAIIPFQADGFGGKFKIVQVELVDGKYRVLVVIMR